MAISNYQPSLALTQFLTAAGIFPSNGGGGTGIPMATVRTFAGNFVPGGDAAADGHLISIADNEVLFALLGTNFGGDGQTTYGVPDLQLRSSIGVGAGPGLTPHLIAETDGTATLNLSTQTVPLSGGAGGQPIDNVQPSLAVKYLIKTQGIFPSPGGGGGSIDLLGQVVEFAGTFVPGGYLEANGQLLSIAQNSALFALLGTQYGGDGQTTFALPDLRGRSIVGATNSQLPGTQSGTENINLTTANMPLAMGGSGVPVNNTGPVLELNYLISLYGLFPSIGGGGSADPEIPYVGEIMAFAGNFAPSGWAIANGQVLPISQNQPLFVLLGNTYGGDGQTTFALPDLRGRSIVGSNASTPAGTVLGEATHTITTADFGALDLTGSDFANDQLYGADGVDILRGGNGDDTLTGNKGGDDLNGGVNGAGGDTASYRFSSTGVYVDLNDTGAQLGNGGEETGDVLSGIENILGSAHSDYLIGHGGANTITGGDGDDSVEGLGGTDNLIGGSNGPSGDTVVYLNAGSAVTVNLAVTGPQNTGTTTGIDTISGFENAYGSSAFGDLLTGSDGNNSLWGDGGLDRLYGGGGADRLDGGAGDDILEGGAGIDTYIGGLGNDAYYVRNLGSDGRVEDIFMELANQGIDGINTTVSINLNEARYANIENGYLSGAAAVNLGGSAANNVMVGNSAANSIYGLGGRDIMRGEGGADKFVYLYFADTGKTAATRDLIQDFTSGVDKIDLFALDANGAGTGNGTFAFLAVQGAAFTNIAGQLRFFWEDNVNNALDKTIIEADFNGDHIADTQIELTGLKTLLIGDFVL